MASKLWRVDTVICMRVLPHLDDSKSALTKMCNAVKVVGNVVFDLWNIYSFIGVIRRLFKRSSYLLTRFYRHRQTPQSILIPPSFSRAFRT